MEPLATAVESFGFMRRSVGLSARQPGHKEWLHFVVHGEGFSALVNFSISDDVRPGAPAGAEIGRVTCIVRTDGWEGDVDTYASSDIAVQGGKVGLRLGDASVTFQNGAFHVVARLRNRPIDLDMVLEPLTFPSQSNNVVFDDCPPLSWLVVPRLLASGTIRVRNDLFELRAAPAYHDHNWGHFRWGKNFVWEWGYGVPRRAENPFSIVFVRFMDRGHLCDLMQGVLVWRGEHQVRIFRGEEVRVNHVGLLSAPRAFKLPRAMALVAPGAATDVPVELVVSAQSGGDAVELRFVSEHVAQIITPNDDDLGVTIINEVSGTLSAEGKLHGESLHLQEPTTFEFLSE